MMTRRRLGTFAAGLLGLFGVRAVAKSRTLAEDIVDMSAWIAGALQSSGYNADFSPSSIAEIERFFVDHTRDGKAVRGGLLEEGLGARLFALGSYCGEVLRRELRGEWITDDNDPAGEVNATLKLGNGATCWPMQRVGKRFQSDEDNLVHWAASLREG